MRGQTKTTRYRGDHIDINSNQNPVTQTKTYIFQYFNEANLVLITRQGPPCNTTGAGNIVHVSCSHQTRNGVYNAGHSDKSSECQGLLAPHYIGFREYGVGSEKGSTQIKSSGKNRLLSAPAEK